MTESFLQLTQRLSEASVRRRSEAYRDIEWDGPAMAVHPDDPRWAAAPWDPLAGSEWYRDQSPERRAAIGLYRQAAFFKVGIEFERVLSAGLLGFAARLPNGHPAFRYVYHEIAEEAQHTMMFQEFINRTGCDPGGVGGRVEELFDRVAGFGGDLPILFFLAALSGEEAFDYVNRQTLGASSTHPLLAAISRIHVTEEARHVSFARAFLRDAVPRLSDRERRRLRYEVPFVIDWTATHLFTLTEPFLADADVPVDVQAAIARSPRAQAVRAASVAGVVGLCRQLGLVDDRLATVWSRVRPPD